MSDLKLLQKLDNKELHLKCIQHGLPNIPVTNSSRKLLIRKLYAAITTPRHYSTKKSHRRDTIHNLKPKIAKKLINQDIMREQTVMTTHRPKTRRTIASMKAQMDSESEVNNNFLNYPLKQRETPKPELVYDESLFPTSDGGKYDFYKKSSANRRAREQAELIADLEGQINEYNAQFGALFKSLRNASPSLQKKYKGRNTSTVLWEDPDQDTKSYMTTVKTRRQRLSQLGKSGVLTTSYIQELAPTDPTSDDVNDYSCEAVFGETDYEVSELGNPDPLSDDSELHKPVDYGSMNESFQPQQAPFATSTKLYPSLAQFSDCPLDSIDFQSNQPSGHNVDFADRPPEGMGHCCNNNQSVYCPSEFVVGPIEGIGPCCNNYPGFHNVEFAGSPSDGRGQYCNNQSVFRQTEFLGSSPENMDHFSNNQTGLRKREPKSTVLQRTLRDQQRPYQQSEQYHDLKDDAGECDANIEELSYLSEFARKLQRIKAEADKASNSLNDLSRVERTLVQDIYKKATPTSRSPMRNDADDPLVKLFHYLDERYNIKYWLTVALIFFGILVMTVVFMH